jgi:hypothetical protein
MSLIVTGIVSAVGLGISAYSASQQAGIAGQAENLAGAQFGEQQWYNQQLQGLIQNPSSWLKNPVFQSSLNLGLEGVNRTEAATGNLNSGAQSAALEQYGQSTALSSLFQQEGILGSLTGLGSNPATALGTASGASATGASELSGGMNTAVLAAILGSSGGSLFGNAGSGGVSATGASTDALQYYISDRRVKKNIRRVGTTAGGQPWYEFEYTFRPGKQYGVMADESPVEAVMTDANGFAYVNYQRIR